MTLTFHAFTRAACFAAAMSTLTGCPGKEAETDSDSATASDSATGGPTTGPTTGETPTTSGATTEDSDTTLTGAMSGTTTGTATTGETIGGTTVGTTADVETGTTALTTEGTTEGTTTGEMIPEALDEACQAACENFFACLPQPPFPDVDACKGECAGALGSGPTCLEDTVAFNNCIGDMTCEQLEDAFVNEEFGPCTDEFEAMQIGCQVCDGFGSGGPNACSLGQQCPGEPKQEFSCVGDTCTCLVDDQAVGTCPAPAAICDGDEATLAMAANDCCGFEF